MTGPPLRIAATARLVDDAEMYLPETWTARAHADMHYRHRRWAHAWLSTRATLAHRFEANAEHTTVVRLHTGASILAARRYRVSAGLLTQVTLATSRAPVERFVHQLHAGLDVRDNRFNVGFRAFLPIDRSQRARTRIAIDLHASVGF